MLIYSSIGQARNTETERPCHPESVTGLQSRVSEGSTICGQNVLTQR